MRKFFLLGVNIVLIGMIVSLGFWLFTGIQDKQVKQFIEEKQKVILSKGKVTIQEGNIGTTHVVMALPTDNSGRVIDSIESRMLSYVRKRFGHEKPVGKIDELVFLSVNEAETSFANVKARDIQAEQYKVEYLQIKKQETLLAEPVLLTAENQLFTLDKFLTDLPAARKIMLAHLKEDLQVKGMTKAESEGIIDKFSSLDLNILPFTYKEKQLLLQLPHDYGIAYLKVPISVLYKVVRGDYLMEEDKADYDQYVSKHKKQLRQIALTFDDGPNPETTPVVLDLLKKYNAKATFFVIGRAIAGNEAILRRMVAEGHVIANHTWNHPDLVTLSPELVRKEIQDTQAVIKEVAGVVPTMVRPPYGTINQSVVDQMGLPSIYWSVDSKDWKSRNPQAILSEIKAQTRPGSIILMHDIHQPTVDSLESVLQFLTSERYNMVTVADLLGSNLNPQHIYYSQESSGPAH